MDIIVPVFAKDFVNNEVPKKTRAKIPPLIFDAYALAEQATEDTDFLAWIIGEKNKGYLKRIAVEYMLKDAIDRGKLPFEYKIAPNSNNSSLHLEIATGNAIITTSQVQNIKSLPNRAFFRDKLQDANQLRFPLDTKDEQVTAGPYHLLLTHGYATEKPGFVNLGFPNESGWVYCTNLLNEPTLIERPVRKPIDTKEKLVSFKDFAKEVSENGNKR